MGSPLSGDDRWKQSEDTVGVAAAINGLSADHADYLKAGGVGFIIGDGRLSYTAAIYA